MYETHSFSVVSTRMYTMALSELSELEPQVMLNSKPELEQQPGRPSGEVAFMVPLGQSKSFSSSLSHCTNLQIRTGWLATIDRSGSVVHMALASVPWNLNQSGSVAPSSMPVTSLPSPSQSPIPPKSWAVDSVSLASLASLHPLEPVDALVDAFVLDAVELAEDWGDVVPLALLEPAPELLADVVSPAPSPEPPTSSNPGSGGSPPQAKSTAAGSAARAEKSAKQSLGMTIAGYLASTP